ncbi:hypothetical protein C1645_837297 [Glomus cerebriforme]|uniref:F-box domain-containing protein n=1 Tax=Glomus cerebriforme TaxID=658196 RepID=A0A397S6Y3_9GLOM|nr:hypothetical protein C1645_837297 [Glomus cerebriforme]
MSVFYYNLQILELINIPLRIITNIIQNTGGNLWRIKIRITDFDCSKEYNSAIYKYCPYIKYSSIILDNQNLDELKDVLIRCKHLEALDVIVDYNKHYYGDHDKFLDLLIKLAPDGLYKFHMNWEIFNIESLQLFFNNWKGRKTLQLYDHMSNWLFIIELYEIEGIVGYKDCEGFWDDDNYTKITWKN